MTKHELLKQIIFIEMQLEDIRLGLKLESEEIPLRAQLMDLRAKLNSMPKTEEEEIKHWCPV